MARNGVPASIACFAFLQRVGLRDVLFCPTRRDEQRDRLLVTQRDPKATRFDHFDSRSGRPILECTHSDQRSSDDCE